MFWGIQDFAFCPNVIEFCLNFTKVTQILPKVAQILLNFTKVCPNFTKFYQSLPKFTQICPNFTQIDLNFAQICLKNFLGDAAAFPASPVPMPLAVKHSTRILGPLTKDNVSRTVLCWSVMTDT